MNIKRNSLRPAILSLLALTALVGRAVPAKPGLHTYTMPDGAKVSVSIVGDEYSHHYVTSDGYLLLPAEDGTLHFATYDAGGHIVASSLVASDPAVRTADQQLFLSGIDRGALLDAATAKTEKAIKRAKKQLPAELVTKYPATGKPKGLVLLVEFQDVKFSVPDPQKTFTDLMNKKGYDFNGATGSVIDYYTDNSNGTFTPDFQVYGPVTLPENEIYYGKESGMMYDAQGWLMARDGVIALHEQHPELDFSEFDNDGDGYVDNVFIFYAGYGQNEGGPSWAIWPHSAQLWTMYNIDVTYNGVKIDKYACTNELKGTEGVTLCGIGTFVHEYSHILGLMDHYPTALANRGCSPGSWDVMDMGSYNNGGHTPPHLNAFERYCLGWLNPRKLTGPENISLSALHTSNEALLIETEKPEEFFLLENRQREKWDTALPGHGMLIWHIDYDKLLWSENQINNEFNHQRVDLVEADNIVGEGSRSADAFPGTSAVHEFTATSNPAMTTWIGVDPDMPLTDIYEVEGIITMKVKGGGTALEAPVAKEATELTSTGFTANWQLVAGINKYVLDVCKGATQVPFLTIDVDQATSYAVTGLEPSTEYTYVVRSRDGDRMSADSQRVNVTTLAPTLDMLAPTALSAQDVDAESFKACWTPMEGATGYMIDVYEKRIIDPQTDLLDFTDGVTLPAGWTTNCSSTGSLSGYVGEAAPSLRMMNNHDRLVSPAYPGGINSLSFWYRGNSTKDDASLTVESMQNGSWTPIYTIKPVVKIEGVTVKLGGDNADAQLPSGTTQLRIVFNKETNGSLYLDDVELAHDASFEPVYHTGYEKCDVSAGTTTHIHGLKPLTRYHYVVYGYDATGVRSLPSNEIEVITADPTAVESVTLDADIIVGAGYVSVAGAENSLLTVTTIAGMRVHTSRLADSTPVTIYLPAGIYLITVEGRVYKVAVR